MPLASDHALLFDPHLDLNPAAFVATWNDHVDTVTTARLATIHNNLLVEKHSLTNIILITGGQHLEPNNLHDLIQTVANRCGIEQPLHFVPLTRPDGSPFTLVAAVLT